MKKLILIISLFVAVSCVQKEKENQKDTITQIKVCDDRLMNSSILNKILHQYFSHKELDGLKYFNLEIYDRYDCVKIVISPLIQKKDTCDGLPSSYLKFGEKEIFGISSLQTFSPIDDKSLTVIKYRETLKKLPEWVDIRGKKYPIWRILLKNNSYRIDSILKAPRARYPIKFVPPVIPK